MITFNTLVTLWLLSVSTWVTPQPKLSEGLLINYGDRSYLEGNAQYRGYDLSPYFHRCAIASVSPAHLGRIAWVRVDGSKWYGPCLVVDVGARHHAYEEIYFKQKVAELPRYLITDWFGAKHGIWGYVYFGECPPTDDVAPKKYRPPLKFDDGTERQPLFWPYPEQQMPVSCRVDLDLPQ